MSKTINFESILKSKGLKVTKHRNSVLTIMEEFSQPLSAEDIYFKLKEKEIAINPSSIYKILDILCDCSVINKCLLGDSNKTLYEINHLDHKHHLICKTCKRVFPLTNCPLSNYNKELENSMGFQITNHKLEIYGYCKECQN